MSELPPKIADLPEPRSHELTSFIAIDYLSIYFLYAFVLFTLLCNQQRKRAKPGLCLALLFFWRNFFLLFIDRKAAGQKKSRSVQVESLLQVQGSSRWYTYDNKRVIREDIIKTLEFDQAGSGALDGFFLFFIDGKKVNFKKQSWKSKREKKV